MNQLTKLQRMQEEVKHLQKEGRVIEMRRLANHAGKLWEESVNK